MVVLVVVPEVVFASTDAVLTADLERVDDCVPVMNFAGRVAARRNPQSSKSEVYVTSNGCVNVRDRTIEGELSAVGVAVVERRVTLTVVVEGQEQ